VIAKVFARVLCKAGRWERCELATQYRDKK